MLLTNRLLLFAVALFAAAVMLDYKTVKLEYVSKVTITPSVSKYRGKSYYAFFVRSGDDLKEYMENELFPEHYKFLSNETLHGKPYPVAEPYKLRWEKGFATEDNAVYYAGLGCEIGKISYFYHTRYTNYLNDSSIFVIHSASLKPLDDKSIIMIYKGDVAAAELP